MSLSCGEDAANCRLDILPGTGDLESWLPRAWRGNRRRRRGGNQGERGFPAQSAGDRGGGSVLARTASCSLRFASAFTSRLYPNRKVPDLCGLCGEGQHADYIMLPVPSGSDHDKDRGAFDGTGKKDGWARFSGTSAAAPQLAGVCALLLQQDPGLTPERLKKRLLDTASDVESGAAAATGPQGGLAAAAGRDRATGAGLVNAAAALGLL